MLKILLKCTKCTTTNLETYEREDRSQRKEDAEKDLMTDHWKTANGEDGLQGAVPAW